MAVTDRICKDGPGEGELIWLANLVRNEWESCPSDAPVGTDHYDGNPYSVGIALTALLSALIFSW